MAIPAASHVNVEEPSAPVSFTAARHRLHDAMDGLIDGAARLQEQLQRLAPPVTFAVKLIKEHVRDETEDFAQAAIFISLRLHQLWSTANPAGTVVVEGKASDPAFECLRILQNSSDVLAARLRWAQQLGPGAPIDTRVLTAYSILQGSSPAASGECDDTPGVLDTVTHALTHAGSHIRKHRTATAVACAAIGALTASWFYGRFYRPLHDSYVREQIVTSLLEEGQFTHRQIASSSTAHWNVKEQLYQSKLRQVVRTGAFCSLAAVGVSALGVKYLDEAASAASEHDPLALTSLFLEKLNELRDTCRTSAGVSIPSILESLESCWSLLVAYMAFTDLRECCICREIVTPKDVLVSSEGAPSDCSTKHVFHEGCLPLEYALRAGCPVCRRPIIGFQAVRVDPLFRFK